MINSLKAANALRTIRTSIIACCAVTSSVAFASEFEVWQGWMNLTPCSKVEWTNDGIFGTPSPTLRTAAQELHGRILANVPDSQGAIDALQCAAQAAAVTTAAAIVTNGAGGWPAFTSTFYGCMKDRAYGHLVSDLRLETWGQCNW